MMTIETYIEQCIKSTNAAIAAAAREAEQEQLELETAARLAQLRSFEMISHLVPEILWPYLAPLPDGYFPEMRCAGWGIERKLSFLDTAEVRQFTFRAPGLASIYMRVISGDQISLTVNDPRQFADNLRASDWPDAISKAKALAQFLKPEGCDDEY